MESDSNLDHATMGSLITDDERFPKPLNRRPPRWAVWLLSHFCPDGLKDELQGDLQEMYIYWMKTIGV